jgi:hypothetical protein
MFEWEKNKTTILTIIFALIGIFLLIYLIIIAIHYEKYDFIPFLGSVFIGTAGLIGVLYSDKKNRENIIIQARYEKIDTLIFNLKFFLLDTKGVYHDLKKLTKPESEKFLTPQDFLLLQLVLIISDKRLMGNLPRWFREEIQGKFQYNLKNPKTDLNTEELENIQLSKDSITSGEMILQFQDIYNDFCNDIKEKWNKSHRYRGFYYIYHDNITEEELYNHLNHILQIIFDESIEEMILKDHKN